jgi:zinc transport system substrate-binding protein
MAEVLAEADPANAAAYRANAAAGQAEINALMAEIAAKLAPVAGRGFIVFHDAYQYFESRFGVPATGALTLSDATAPSAARVAEVRETIVDLQALCVFAEPQFEPRIVTTVTEGTNARRGVLDPIGADLEPGAALYPALLRGLAGSLAACLG